MRTLVPATAAHLSTPAQTPARMLRLDLVDGSVLAITDHDRDLDFDLGDGLVTYSAATGILPSALALSTGFTADDMEVVGPVTDNGLTTRVALQGGRFDDAVGRYFELDWSNPVAAIALARCYVAGASVEGDRFRLTLHTEASKFARTIGRLITGYCDADFGDARCGFTPVEITGTVTAVTDERAFSVSFAGSYADDVFNRGTARFTSGALAGTRPVEVFDWSAAGAVALWMPLPAAPEIGDTCTITQGCGKTRADCIAFDNVVNFRGFPDVPGSDQVLRYPNPGG